MSITSIENLSNDFFYELFDYLDGYHIYESFSNLNYRFEQLLKSSYLLFKIKLDSLSDELYSDTFTQFILLNKHQMLSFHVSIPSEDELRFSLFPINSSFDHLESLVLNDVESTILCLILSNLTCLPRLFSLTINTWHTLQDLNDIYRLIFDLPKLKSIKLSAEYIDTSLSLPFALEKQMSTIEHLLIDHPCTLNELSALLSHTPQLRRLKFTDSNDSNSTITTILPPIRLENLTNISFDVLFMTFDEFKMFIKNFECKLKVLHIKRGSTRESSIFIL